MRPQAYLSRATSPAFNLAWEDFLLRTAPQATPVCFLYQNSPCVVVGKNQNVWGEVDPGAMRQGAVPVVRRNSGGGTVYHDLGNTNFSFHIPRADFVRSTHTDMVAHALASPPISLPPRFARPPVFRNERNDLVVYAANASDAHPDALRKISGSSYKIAGQRAYHHGTLLLHANLARIRYLRRTPRVAMESRGVDSVPSPVANLQETFAAHAPMLQHTVVARAICDAFFAAYGAGDVIEVDETALPTTAQSGTRTECARAIFDEIRSWKWVYGANPDLCVHVDAQEHHFPLAPTLALALNVQRGTVAHVHATGVDSTCRAMQSALASLHGERYDALATAPPSDVPFSRSALRDGSSAQRALWQWLHTVL
ncbi:lipoate--protein ligase [Malassezia vespertilionis]|uniref:Putative lipoate-protein ligase A n=1 Tax=Malassezia vespertilionis TaxID=2020962 RepID=A0A2N1J9Z9_9BASI|nr:lipoate--protein ligase [Malassezia vespertilionis]PKI83381.1 Aim22p [Malassezia vespertilionis]WFD07135.1 lipoate--protein ligase [Malassezia vespertilionis]